MRTGETHIHPLTTIKARRGGNPNSRAQGIPDFLLNNILYRNNANSTG
jgi:hypothetical protein